MREKHLALLDQLAKLLQANPDCVIVEHRFSREYWTPTGILLFSIFVNKDGSIVDFTNKTRKNQNR